MADKDLNELLGGVFDSFSSLTKNETATLTSIDSAAIDLDKLIEDNIYGLLALDELSIQQIALLNVLLKGRKT